MNDFPWVEWVHDKAKKPICSSPSLEFKTGASGTEGLEGLSVRCTACDARATLKGAFDKECFQRMDEENGRSDFICPGNHPFKHVKEKCDCYPHTVQRLSLIHIFPKIERNIQRDIEVTSVLKADGWIVLRFWGKEIKRNVCKCADSIETAVKNNKREQ